MKETIAFEVRKPLREAFEVLTDLETLAALSEGKLAIEKVPDRPRRGKGAAVLLRAGAAAGDILCETVEWDPPNRCARRLGIKDLPTTLALSFAEIPGGTRVTLDLELEPQSMLYKMMLPALALKVKADKDRLVAELQRRLAQDGTATA